MDQSQEDKHLEFVATETLDQFEKVSSAAKKALSEAPVSGVNAFATVNTMTGTVALQNLNQISLEVRRSCQILASEPAIARVVVVDEEGKESTYYICRTVAPSGFLNCAGYHAPVGRLASLPIGSEFTMRNGTTVEVIEQVKLRPIVIDGGWDSRDTIFETENLGPLTIESLRALLKEKGIALTEDLLQQLLAAETRKANIIEGMRRTVITKMALRDQPILDQYQDEIFRLPLNKRLVILGPPGTGKTTTLIRRLGQKLNLIYLDENEQRIVKSVGEINGISHSDSWLMFTPTELLKQYLKEAFAREAVPAPDLRIKTWDDFRRELARNTFDILRTASGGGSFILKESLQSQRPEAIVKSIDWFSDFDEWQQTTYINELLQSSQILSKNQLPEVERLGQRLLSIIESTTGKTLAASFKALSNEVAGVNVLVTGWKEFTDSAIKGVLNLQLNRNKSFLDELAKFIDELQKIQDTESDDAEDLDAEEEDISIPKTGMGAAASAYMQAVRAQARAYASKRPLSKKSRNGKIVEWIGVRTLNEHDLAEVGASLLVQTNARRFVNPVKRYIEGIPKRYRSFRRIRHEEGKWYVKGGFSITDIHPLELDIILLGILRGAKDLLSIPSIIQELDATFWVSLKQVSDLYKNQIVVDEATDFSPIQLACMAALTHTGIRSFFACGDFNQRLTIWGSRSIDDLKWVYPDIEAKQVTVSYRHSRQLNELARAIIKTVGGTDQDIILPEHVDNEGVSPALLESASDEKQVVNWLASRIREIESFVGQLPSTAIFVNSEPEVERVASALNVALSEHNIKVVACQNGRVMGQDNDVRVFDIQHIKGLEFEAVFFIAIDHLAEQQPELFDKYLYVGTTRAAMYLGITCNKVLPNAMSTLRPMFIEDWRSSL